MSKKNIKNAFTLVEMLIVVVIIGILAAALLPRLTWAQERARDTARQWHLSQISTALGTYQSDNWAYPDANCIDTLWANVLIPKYIKSLPKDPQEKRVTHWTVDNWCGSWNYAYTPMIRNGATAWWFVLIADTESQGKNNNFVLSNAANNITFLSWWTDTLPDSNAQWNYSFANAENAETYVCSKWVDIKSWTPNTLTWTCTAIDNKAAVYVLFQ